MGVRILKILYMKKAKMLWSLLRKLFFYLYLNILKPIKIHVKVRAHYLLNMYLFQIGWIARIESFCIRLDITWWY